MSQLNPSEIQSIAKEEHKRFVDFMYPIFGLGENPGHCRIIIKPLWRAGEFSYDKDIYIDSGFIIEDSDSPTEDIRYTTWHESGHFLHWKRRGLLPVRKRRGGNFRNDFYNYIADPVDWGECVANLGGLIFMNSTEGFGAGFIKARRYFGMRTLDKDETALINIALTNKELLKRIAGHKNIYKSMKLIRSYS